MPSSFKKPETRTIICAASFAARLYAARGGNSNRKKEGSFLPPGGRRSKPIEHKNQITEK